MSHRELTHGPFGKPMTSRQLRRLRARGKPFTAYGLAPAAVARLQHPAPEKKAPGSRPGASVMFPAQEDNDDAGS